MEVIRTEYPIHYELLCQRLAPQLGNEKATIKIRREVDYCLDKLANMIIKKGDFLFPKNYKTIHVRMPNDRKIQHICIEEISEAMFKILSTYIGATRETLCAETTRVYGFNRAGQNIQSAMEKAIDELIDKGRIIESDGKLNIVNR